MEFYQGMTRAFKPPHHHHLWAYESQGTQAWNSDHFCIGEKSCEAPQRQLGQTGGAAQDCRVPAEAAKGDAGILCMHSRDVPITEHLQSTQTSLRRQPCLPPQSSPPPRTRTAQQPALWSVATAAAPCSGHILSGVCQGGLLSAPLWFLSRFP